jgi:hypothetical protein
VLRFFNSRPLHIPTLAIEVRPMRNDTSQKETINELMPWIEKSSPPEISKWVAGVLRGDIWYYPVELRRSTPEEVLLAVYRYSNDVEFQYRLKEALTLVAQSVSWRHEDPNYLSNLLASMGYLNAHPGYDLLIRLGLKRTLMERWLKPGVSLHRFLLASLAGMGCNSRSIHLFVRDTNVPEYAGICFRAIWPYDPEIAIEVSDTIVKIGAADSHFPTQLLLKEMVSNLSLALAWRLIDRVLTSERLNDEQKSYFATYVRLGKLGVGLNPHSSYFELIRLGVTDERLSIPFQEVKHDIFRHLLDNWAVDFTKVVRSTPQPREKPRRESMLDLRPVLFNPQAQRSHQRIQA